MNRILGFVAAGLALAAGVPAFPASTSGVVEVGWREFRLAGMPGSASVHSVAAGAGGFAAVGNDLAKDDERNGFVVWHSADGETWSEVLRSVGNSVADANIVAVGGGFAAIGTTCVYPNASGSGPDGARCEPLAFASSDGVRWEGAEIQVGTGEPPSPNALVSDLGVSDTRLVAGGWIERSQGARDPATWHSGDGGRSWALAGPVPANSEKSDEIRRLSRVDGGWLAAGVDELERSGSGTVQAVQQQPRLWRSPDGLGWERIGPPSKANDVHLLTGSRDASYVSGGGSGGVSVWRAEADGQWFDTRDGFAAGNPSSLAVLEGDRDGLVLGGMGPQADGKNRPVLWGSVDGVTYRRTLTLADSTSFLAAVLKGDHWYVYGHTTTSNGEGTILRGWVASIQCATGQTCPALAK